MVGLNNSEEYRIKVTFTPKNERIIECFNKRGKRYSYTLNQEQEFGEFVEWVYESASSGILPLEAFLAFDNFIADEKQGSSENERHYLYVKKGKSHYHFYWKNFEDFERLGAQLVMASAHKRIPSRVMSSFLSEGERIYLPEN
jgi:hypothetical protein